ncbi:hypothetical protein ACWD0A_23100 [Streptomyces sp. NPDC002867]
MLIGRDRRRRVAVTASLLLGLLGTLLGCVAALSAEGEAAASHAGSNRGAVTAGPDVARGGAVGVRTGAGSAPGEAVVAGAAQPPGCGERTGAGDSGAHPGVPPRGGSAYELLPALPQTHGSGGVALVCDQTALDVSPLRGPPPLAPPSAVDLSVLRV